MACLADGLNDCWIGGEGSVFHVRFGILVVSEGLLE